MAKSWLEKKCDELSSFLGYKPTHTCPNEFIIEDIDEFLRHNSTQTLLNLLDDNVGDGNVGDDIGYKPTHTCPNEFDKEEVKVCSWCNEEIKPEHPKGKSYDGEIIHLGCACQADDEDIMTDN